MQLPDEDEEFLQALGVDWEVLPDGESAAFLIIKNFDASGGGFTPGTIDLMLRIPAQYPMTPLDMWYCDPAIKLGATGDYADRSDKFETYLERSWQRFSRHLPGGSWRPGIDGLKTFFTFIFKELQGKRGQ